MYSNLYYFKYFKCIQMLLFKVLNPSTNPTQSIFQPIQLLKSSDPIQLFDQSQLLKSGIFIPMIKMAYFYFACICKYSKFLKTF